MIAPFVNVVVVTVHWHAMQSRTGRSIKQIQTKQPSAPGSSQAASQRLQSEQRAGCRRTCDMLATTRVRPRLAQSLRPTAATARTTRLQRFYASSDATARPWQRPDTSHWRVRLTDRDLKVAEELCIGPPFGEISFSMHDPSQGPVITRDAHYSYMDEMLAKFEPVNPFLDWQSQLEEDGSFQVWRTLLEREVYPKYDLNASSIQGAIDQMAGFVVQLLEWEVDGYVLEGAEEGRIRARPW